MDVIRIFAYGSLMHDPECPEHLVSITWAKLPDHERLFHKISTRRGCFPDASIAPDLNVPAPFRGLERNLSLVLGLIHSPGKDVTGRLLTYHAEAGPLVLKQLDAREGYVPERTDLENAYLRRRCEVQLHSAEEKIAAITYVTSCNKANSAIASGLDLETQARILIRATPREDPERRCGLYYLEEVRAALLQGRKVDENLESLAVQVYKRLKGKSLSFLPPRNCHGEFNPLE